MIYRFLSFSTNILCFPINVLWVCLFWLKKRRWWWLLSPLRLCLRGWVGSLSHNPPTMGWYATNPCHHHQICALTLFVNVIIVIIFAVIIIIIKVINILTTIEMFKTCQSAPSVRGLPPRSYLSISLSLSQTNPSHHISSLSLSLSPTNFCKTLLQLTQHFTFSFFSQLLQDSRLSCNSHPEHISPFHFLFPFII